MAISTEKVVDTYLNIVAGVPLNCNWPLYDEDEVIVIYGKASLVAELNVDYTVALNPPNYDQFTITPTATLIAKINALIGLDAEEINYATVRRELDYTTSTLPESVRQSTFISREFERIAMKLQQLSERLSRALKFPESEKGGDFIATMPKAEDRARKALVFDEDGDLTVSVGDFEDVGIIASEAAASAAAAAASAAAAGASEAIAVAAAAAAALQAAQFTGTSTDAVLIGTGAKVFATQAGKLFNGENVRVYSAANVNNYMDGIATYAGTALSVAVTSIGGAGTPNDWIIKVNGAKGETGAQGIQFPIAAAGGTVNAITANYTPDVTLTNFMLVAFTSSGANTTTAPTFSPDGLTPRTIVKRGGSALVAGDIGAAGSVHFLEYNSAATRWELINPCVTVTATGTETLTNKTLGAGTVLPDGVTPKSLGAQTLTGVTEIPWTTVPATANKLTLNYSTVSTNGTALIKVQVGAGAYATTGYSNTVTTNVAAANATNTFTDGFNLRYGAAAVAASSITGVLELVRIGATNEWIVSIGNGQVDGGTQTFITLGKITLGGNLDRLRMIADGVNFFDLGTGELKWSL